MNVKGRYLVALAGLVLLACVPVAAAESVDGAESPEVDSAEACLDYTPAGESALEPALLLGIEPEAVAPKPKPCRQACPDQPWCACTYNGAPRISCDPCCYQRYDGVICTS